MDMNKRRCAIIGCSGMAGQQFIDSLQNHPWFEIRGLFGSSRTNKSFKEVIQYSDIPFTQKIEEMQVNSMKDFNPEDFEGAQIPASGGLTLAQFVPILSDLNSRYQVVGLSVVEFASINPDMAAKIPALFEKSGITCQFS